LALRRKIRKYDFCGVWKKNFYGEKPWHSPPSR
jgi:hypothetical protein